MCDLRALCVVFPAILKEFKNNLCMYVLDNKNYNHFIGIKVASGIIGVLAVLAFGIAGYIYYKSCRKSRRQLSKSFDHHEDEMDTL